MLNDEVRNSSAVIYLIRRPTVDATVYCKIYEHLAVAASHLRDSK